MGAEETAADPPTAPPPPPSPTRRWWRRIGRRGAMLLFLACLDVIYATSLAHPPAESARNASLLYVSTIAPLWCWAALWGGVGVVCLVQAFVRHDQIAFTAAMGLKVLWGLTFLLGWLFVGLDRGWVSAVVWLAFAAEVYVVSGWPEAAPRTSRPARVEGSR